jgi:hypothetical protein
MQMHPVAARRGRQTEMNSSGEEKPECQLDR